MSLLYFALHLRTLSPPLLSQLKQCLLELANLYALSPPSFNSKRRKIDSSVVDDKIGLCYFQPSSNSSDELKVAYSPRGKHFSLRDFHYAVNLLPSESFSPPLNNDSFVFCDLNISCLLSDKLLHSTAGQHIERKVVLISSCLIGIPDTNMRKSLLDAADRCVSVEFLFLEQKSNQLGDISESINKFKEQICDLENCSFNAYLSDGQVFNGLVKRWIGELKDNTEKLLQARLIFQSNIAGSISEISCNLCSLKNQIMDVHIPCKPHGCLGICWDGRDVHVSKDPLSCNQEPDRSHEKTDQQKHFTEELWRSWRFHCELSSVVCLNVMERTHLASLSEGVVVGKPYVVLPSANAETDTIPDESETVPLNNNLFQGLCGALCSLNQGLVCCSSCNIETMRETAFHYYYILQPSDNGLMLLRLKLQRLAGAEEILPFPDVIESDFLKSEEIDKSIQVCLEGVELKDYNPVHHNGGFHQKVNQLVQESLQLGLVTPGIATTDSEFTFRDPLPVHLGLEQPADIASRRGESCRVNQPHDDSEIVDLTQEWEQLVCNGSPKMAAVPPEPYVDKRVSEEWEQLIVGAVPTISPEPRMGKSVTSPSAAHKPPDTRTSNILERLGNPKQIKTKSLSPTVVSGTLTNADAVTENRRPVLAGNADKGLITTNTLLKPSFHRLKRKLR